MIPFVGVGVGDFFKFYCFDFYIFGLDDIKDFYTVWITGFGIIGLAYNISQNQIRISNQSNQIELQKKEQRDVRFSKGIDLLGHAGESSRIGGAYTLYYLAKEFPKEYQQAVVEILCSHIRTVTSLEAYVKLHIKCPSNEIYEIIKLLFNKKEDEFILSKGDFYPNISGSNLQGSILDGYYMNNVIMNDINLNNSELKNCTLIKSNLTDAILNDINIVDTIIQESSLEYANFRNASFRNVDLSKSNLLRSDLSKSNFDKVNLSASDLSHTILFDVTFLTTNISGSHFQFADINKSRMGECNLENAFFDLESVTNIEFIDCYNELKYYQY